MRLESSLFAAVLFVCFNISSTSSISTSVRSLTSKQEDVAAHRVGVMSSKEERIFEFLGLDNIQEGFSAIKSKIMEIRICKTLFAEEKEVMDAYKSLQFDQVNSDLQRNARSNALLKYLAYVTETSFPSLSRFTKNEGLLKLFIETREIENEANLHAGLKSILIKSWKDHARTSESVFKQLELDTYPTSDHSVYECLFKLWIQYLPTRYHNMWNEIVYMVYRSDDDVRMMILGNLRLIKDSKSTVNFIEKYLLDNWYRKNLPVEKVYNKLHLNTVYDEANYDLWIDYVLRVSKYLSDEEQNAVARLSQRYNDDCLVKMVVALLVRWAGEPLMYKMREVLIETWRTHGKPFNEALEILNRNKGPFIADHKVHWYSGFVKYVEKNLET